MEQNHSGAIMSKDIDIGPVEQAESTTHIGPKGTSISDDSGSGNGRALDGHGVPELVGDNGATNGGSHEGEKNGKGKWFNYMKTKDFWIVLLLG
jgi:solute carrier family 35 protein F1/2